MTFESERPTRIQPGLFGQSVPADIRRGIFDGHNEQILGQNLGVAAVFAGDSITESWALDAFFRSSAGLLVNRGISGDSTPYVRRRFKADVLQLRPRLLVLNIGINNTWDLDQWAEPAFLKTPAEIEQQIVGHIEEMVQAAVSQGIAVALCTLLPTDIGTLTTTPERNKLIASTNDRLRQVAQRYRSVFIDYHAHVTQEDRLTLRPGLSDDGLHPHIVGYRLMARVLLDALYAAGIGTLVPAAPTAGNP